jgi:hypothetical protein
MDSFAASSSDESITAHHSENFTGMIFAADDEECQVDEVNACADFVTETQIEWQNKQQIDWTFSDCVGRHISHNDPDKSPTNKTESELINSERHSSLLVQLPSCSNALEVNSLTAWLPAFQLLPFQNDHEFGKRTVAATALSTFATKALVKPKSVCTIEIIEKDLESM